MVYLNVIITARDIRDADRVGELLKEMARRSKKEPGCARFEVYRSQPSTATFLLVEQWQSQAHLEQHRQAKAFKEFYEPNVLPLVERQPHPSDLIG